MFPKTALKLALLFVLQICPTLEDCSAPPHISNAVVFYEATTKDSSARYTCNPGYLLNGSPVLKCSDKGWIGDRGRKKPQCIAKSCGSPGEILNGRYNATSNNFGAKVIFYCDEGYHLIGRDYRLCEDEGWSGEVPSCEPVKCVDLPSIENGVAPSPPNGEAWEFGSLAKYSCIGDYSLIGAKSLICSSSGQWSDKPPICKDVQCFVPNPPSNGRIRSSSWNVLKYEEEVMFECDHGFEIDGSNVIRCNNDSKFSDDPPTCRFSGCHRPERIIGGWIENPKAIYAKHETVTLTCGRGYKLIGIETLRCKGNDKYDHPSPKCQEIRCQPPLPIQNGDYTPKYSYYASYYYRYNAIITFTCNEGFKLEGSSESRCGDNGVFNPHPPTCTSVYCYSPTIPDHGDIHPKEERYRYHQEITFSCDTGYKLVGNHHSRCEGEGTFKHPPPTCRKVQCRRPTNLIVQPNRITYNYEDRVTFTCQRGFIPRESTESVCVERDTFDPPPPTCKKDDPKRTISTSTRGNINTIIEWSHEIIKEKREIIRMEHQLLQREERILLKYQAIVRNLEILLN
ncbi:sushi, von Willebrand factor type A, EGF and pentraxin domain-containing protein 1-like [Mobula hypostoma]|uniref:sushi, von Willebrand factor type A, EGF and pentraxin domain-containing protein 1-like n=1 Tax=Mobula hypostoma TaxID=723540 RepID=UPI002FC3573A